MTFPDTRAALKDLLNVNHLSAFYGAHSVEASAFISRHGPLRAVTLPRAWLEKIKADPNDPGAQVWILSGLFSAALSVSTEGEAAYPLIDGVLATIFATSNAVGPPQLKVSFLTGSIEPIPRDLLDAIAIEFMHSYKTIGRCERCQRYFFKVYIGADRYCSPPCAQKTRSEAQSAWMRKHRADQKRKKELKQRKTRRKS